MKMNGSWITPEWEAATMALEKLQNDKSSKPSGSGDNSTVTSTSSIGASVGGSETSTQNTMSYNAGFYPQYYGAYQHPYAPYDMYGYGPYGPYGYMSFTGLAAQPPPPPPPSSKSEPKSESANEQSQAASSTAVSVSTETSTEATSNSSDGTAEAGKEVVASSASVTENTWTKASSAGSTSAGYNYPASSWQQSASVSSSPAGMWSQFPNTPRPRPKFSGAAGFESSQTSPPLGSGAWPRSVASGGDTGRFSAGAVRPARPSPLMSVPSLRWSNSPRVNPYDGSFGSFRQAVPKHNSEPYSPFDPTESEECEDQRFGGFAPAPDAGNFRFRMPNRGACRPMQWRQQSPRPNFSPEMHTPPRANWRFGQQRAPMSDEGNAGVRPVVMPRVKNYMPRPRTPWSASPDMQKMQTAASKPSRLQESRWDKDEAVSNGANADKSRARSSAASGALDPASADEWPLSLKQFVHRCFSSVKDDHAKDLMEAKLKVLLTKAFGDGTALTHDWDQEPIPDILNSSASFQPLGSPPSSERYGRPSSHLCSPRNFKFAGSLRGKRGTPSSSSRRGRGRSPPGFRRRSRSRSHPRKSRSRSSSRSSSSSRHSSRSRRRRRRRQRDSRYHNIVLALLLHMFNHIQMHILFRFTVLLKHRANVLFYAVLLARME